MDAAEAEAQAILLDQADAMGAAAAEGPAIVLAEACASRLPAVAVDEGRWRWPSAVR